jgi:hypothetical protein
MKFILLSVLAMSQINSVFSQEIVNARYEEHVEVHISCQSLDKLSTFKFLSIRRSEDEEGEFLKKVNGTLETAKEKFDFNYGDDSKIKEVKLMAGKEKVGRAITLRESYGDKSLPTVKVYIFDGFDNEYEGPAPALVRINTPADPNAIGDGKPSREIIHMTCSAFHKSIKQKL